MEARLACSLVLLAVLACTPRSTPTSPSGTTAVGASVAPPAPTAVGAPDSTTAGASPTDTTTCPAPGDHRLPDGGGYPSGARVLSTGAELVVLWYERGADPSSAFTLRFARLDPRGRVRPGSERLLFAQDGASRGLVQVAMGEGELGLVYKRWTQEVRERRPRPTPENLPPSLPEVRGPLPDPEPTTETVMTSHQTYFARIGFDGSPRGAERPVADLGWNGDHADLAWDVARREWGVIFGAREPSGASPTVHFVRLDAEGERRGQPIRLDAELGFVEAGRALLPRAGGGFLAAWRGEEAQLTVLAPDGDALVARTRALPVGPLGVTLATDGTRVAVAGAGLENPPRVTVALFGSEASDAPILRHTLGAPEAYSGSQALRFDGATLELVFVENFPRQSSAIVAFRFDGQHPEGRREVLVESGASTSLGWPSFVGRACARSFSYLRFGEGAENRLLAR